VYSGGTTHLSPSVSASSLPLHQLWFPQNHGCLTSNTSSYRATVSPPHQSLPNQACSPNDGPLNSRSSLVLHSSSTSPTNFNHDLYLLSFKPLAILVATIFPSGAPGFTTIATILPLFQGSPCVSSIFHDFTLTLPGHLDVFSH
jgi:hypothetical protein